MGAGRTRAASDRRALPLCVCFSVKSPRLKRLVFPDCCSLSTHSTNSRDERKAVYSNITLLCVCAGRGRGGQSRPGDCSTGPVPLRWHRGQLDTSIFLNLSELCLATQACVTLCDLWTVAHQAPLSMGFPRQEYWSGLPFPSPGIFPTQGLNPGLPHYR